MDLEAVIQEFDTVNWADTDKLEKLLALLKKEYDYTLFSLGAHFVSHGGTCTDTSLREEFERIIEEQKGNDL